MTTFALSSASTQLGCTVVGAGDDVSGLTSVEWGVGTLPGTDDVIEFDSLLAPLLASPRNDTERMPTVSVTGRDLLTTFPALGTVVYCTVRLRNQAGLVTLASSDGTRLLETTDCTEPFTCV